MLKYKLARGAGGFFFFFFSLSQNVFWGENLPRPFSKTFGKMDLEKEKKWQRSARSKRDGKGMDGAERRQRRRRMVAGRRKWGERAKLAGPLESGSTRFARLRTAERGRRDRCLGYTGGKHVTDQGDSWR